MKWACLATSSWSSQAQLVARLRKFFCLHLLSFGTVFFISVWFSILFCKLPWVHEVQNCKSAWIANWPSFTKIKWHRETDTHIVTVVNHRGSKRKKDTLECVCRMTHNIPFSPVVQPYLRSCQQNPIEAFCNIQCCLLPIKSKVFRIADSMQLWLLHLKKKSN